MWDHGPGTCKSIDWPVELAAQRRLWAFWAANDRHGVGCSPMLSTCIVNKSCGARPVTRSELLDALFRLKIPGSAYSLDGPGAGECYCLETDARRWTTYYSERGLRRSMVGYSSEGEANEAFLAKLIASV